MNYFKTTLVILLSLFNFSASANVGGSDLQNFNPVPNGTDYVTVHSAKPLSFGQFNFGAFFTYTTNSLPYSTLSAAPNNQTFAEPNDRILNSNLHAAVGLMKGWDLGVSAGFTNSQDIEQSNFLFNYGDTGINDILIRSKVGLYRNHSWALAFIGGVDFDQISNNPFLGDNAGPSFNFEAALDFQLTPEITWAINGGYRLRQEGTPIPNTGVTPMSDQWLYSTALSYATDNKGSALLFELYGSYPTEIFSLPTDRQLSNLETLLGYKWAAFNGLTLHGGFGTELYHGLGSPDFRAYFGLNWTVGASDTSNTIIPTNNSTEIAPREELPSQLPDKQGTDSFADEDGDGIYDIDDRCPRTLPNERVNQYGCPINLDNTSFE